MVRCSRVAVGGMSDESTAIQTTAMRTGIGAFWLWHHAFAQAYELTHNGRAVDDGDV